MMKPYFARNDSHLTYLEPPHLHDPSSVSELASLPSSTLKQLPSTVQAALYDLQQSTSIVYASFVRLQDSLQERFERLMPSYDVDGDITFSESSFFNYINSVRAERTYLLSDSHPDWRHKASLARVAVQPYADLAVHWDATHQNSPSSIASWWEYLQSAVASWCDYAEVLHVPDYEDTIGEYLSIRKQTPTLALDLDETPMETPLRTPTPTNEEEPVSFQINGFDNQTLGSPLLKSGELSIQNLAGLGLTGAIDTGVFSASAPFEFLLRDQGKARDERADSGVSMTRAP